MRAVSSTVEDSLLGLNSKLFFECALLRPVNQNGYVRATKKTDGQTEDKKEEREKQEDVQKDRRRKKFK